MGYYSDFHLEWLSKPCAIGREEPSDDLRELFETSYMHAKWYDAKREVLTFARANPTIEINIYVEGEEKEDTWYLEVSKGKVYFHMGKTVYDPVGEEVTEESLKRL